LASVELLIFGNQNKVDLGDIHEAWRQNACTKTDSFSGYLGNAASTIAQ
jgi:hypothetical protein